MTKTINKTTKLYAGDKFAITTTDGRKLRLVIEQEINTFHKDETGKKNIYDYPELNAELNTLKALLKTYYKTHIREKMFEYELVK